MRKQHKKRFGRKQRRGLSLIEILVSVTIIAMFTGLAAVQAWQLYLESQIKAAGVEVRNLSDALDAYQIKRLGYPPTTDGLARLASDDLLREVPRDPWGHDYVYLMPGRKNPRRFDLYSKGPDGVEQTEDDIW